VIDGSAVRQAPTSHAIILVLVPADVDLPSDELLGHRVLPAIRTGPWLREAVTVLPTPIGSVTPPPESRNGDYRALQRRLLLRILDHAEQYDECRLAAVCISSPETSAPWTDFLCSLERQATEHGIHFHTRQLCIDTRPSSDEYALAADALHKMCEQTARGLLSAPTVKQQIIDAQAAIGTSGRIERVNRLQNAPSRDAQDPGSTHDQGPDSEDSDKRNRRDAIWRFLRFKAERPGATPEKAATIEEPLDAEVLTQNDDDPGRRDSSDTAIERGPNGPLSAGRPGESQAGRASTTSKTS